MLSAGLIAGVIGPHAHRCVAVDIQPSTPSSIHSILSCQSYRPSKRRTGLRSLRGNVGLSIGLACAKAMLTNETVRMSRSIRLLVLLSGSWAEQRISRAGYLD